MTGSLAGLLSGSPYAGLRLDGAIRTSKRKKEAKSPGQQRDIIRSCESTHGYDVQVIHDSGRDESGSTMNRATLNLVMQRAERGETDGLIVALADRLGRAPIEEAMAYVRRFTGVGKLVLADMGGIPIDLRNAPEETNLVMQLQFARQYWLQTATRALASRTAAVEVGKFVGPTPVGFLSDKGWLVNDPDKGPVMHQAFIVCGTRGIHAAVDYLREHLSETTKRDGTVVAKRWNTDEVRRVLSARVYLGESHSGDLVNHEAHDPIKDADGVPLTEEEFLAAQTEPQARMVNREYLLSHLVHCAGCGAGLVGAQQNHMKRTGKVYARMRCSAMAGAGCCTSITGAAIEDRVRGRIALAMGNEKYRRYLEPVGQEKAKSELKRTKDERKAFMKGIAGAGMPAELIAETAAELQQAVKDAEDKLRKVAAACKQREELPLAAEVLHDDAKFLRGLRAVLSAGLVIRVSGGRGPIAERVDCGALDQLDDGLGVRAA